MATALLVAIGIVLLGALVALALFVRWLRRGWTVVADEGAHGSGESVAFWERLRGLLGGGPRRLTYRRDDKGRFRKYRR